MQFFTANGSVEEQANLRRDAEHSRGILSRGSFSPMSSSGKIQQPDAPARDNSEALRLGGPASTVLRRLRSQITLVDAPHEEIAVQAPYTGETFGTIPSGTIADLELAI